MKKLYLKFIIILLFANTNIFSQTYITVNVTDSISGEKLPFICVYIKRNFKTYGALTDFDGNVRFEAKKRAKYKILIKSVDYIHIDTVIHLKNSSIILNFKIKPYAPSKINWLKIYNAEVAKNDLKNGKIQLLTLEFHIVPSKKYLKELNRITKKYGFKYHNITDVTYVGDNKYEAIKEYNSVIMEYLNKINKKGWYKNMRNEINKMNEKNWYKNKRKKLRKNTKPNNK